MNNELAGKFGMSGSVETVLVGLEERRNNSGQTSQDYALP